VVLVDDGSSRKRDEGKKFGREGEISRPGGARGAIGYLRGRGEFRKLVFKVQR